MKIRTRIALQFTLLVAAILMLFSFLIYSVSADYRQDEFFDRLRSKARTTCQLLVKVNGIDKALLRVIDDNTLTEMLDEKVLIFNQKDELIYASVDDHTIRYDHKILVKIRQKKEIEYTQGENEIIGLLYEGGQEPLTVLASGYDKFGKSKLDNLMQTLAWALILGIGLTSILGIYFAGNSLKPISRINREISLITAQNLTKKLDKGNGKDEVAQLAINFNSVLTRLNHAFEQQKSFVSQASHELRTPLAALKLEIQIGQKFVQDNIQLTTIFKNLFNDTEKLISITNNLLFLASSFENYGQLKFKNFRIEDAVFGAVEEITNAHPNYVTSIDYNQIPDTENGTVIHGNEELITRVIYNLVDNACKYSKNQTAQIQISTTFEKCVVQIIDEGPGLTSKDIEHIFEPFYRAARTQSIPGNGIGLSICQKIIALHNGELLVKSTLEKGSTFEIRIDHI